MNQSEVIFETKNQGAGGFSRLLQAFMVLMFGLPAFALPLFTWHELSETPWLILLYIVAWFPLAVLWVLRRLMQRYGLRVYASGEAEIIYPFSVVTLPPNVLATLVIERRYVAALKSNQTWLQFADRDGKVLASLSAMAFSSADLEAFLHALKQTRPDLIIRH